VGSVGKITPEKLGILPQKGQIGIGNNRNSLIEQITALGQYFNSNPVPSPLKMQLHLSAEFLLLTKLTDNQTSVKKWQFRLRIIIFM
jgi:hypothetical protein